MKFLFAVLIAVLSSTANAQVYKCGTVGKIVYSDTPCSPTAQKILSVPSSSGFSGERPKAVEDAQLNLDEAPAECKFDYYTVGDPKGKALSQNAKSECMRNISLKKAGRLNEVSDQAYSMWRDHRQLKVVERTSAAARNSTCVKTGNTMQCN